MRLDDAESKLKDWKWNTTHTAGTGVCPLSFNGSTHRIAVSTAKTKCLGGCADALIVEFFANGTAEHREPAAIPDHSSWLMKLDDYLKQSFGKIDNPELLAAAERDALVEDAVKELPFVIEAKDWRVCPIPEQSETDREEDLYTIAGGRVDAFQKAYKADRLPATQDGRDVATVDYKDRMAVDAFDAYAQMVGEHREYSWKGLIRDGCTAVLSALIGAGKSTFSMNLARAWGLGLPFLERECRQSKTLVVVSPKEYEAWIDTIGFWELKGLVYIVPSTAAHFQTHGQTAEWFDYQMKTFGCRTFVLDTLFDFFGMPPNNSGDSNRIAMNEQTPLLQKVREQNYSGLVTGHAPKSEAKAVDPRDPEESFGGHTAWTAQHRMRMTIRRKSSGINAFVTGRGGFGDEGILKEQLLHFDKDTRIDTLGGLFSDHLGEAAMPEVVDALRDFCEPVSMPQLIEAMGKGPKWVKAGVRTGRKMKVIDSDATKGKRDSKYWLVEQVHEHSLEQPKLI